MYTTAQVAREAGVGAYALYNCIREGTVVPPPRIGRTIIWTEDQKNEVIQYFKTRTRKGAKK